MAIITGTALESNRKFRVNFDGGNLSSDGGLLLLKEFYHKLGVNSMLRIPDSQGLSEPFADALPDYRCLFSG